ncbi:hypothetical protein B0O80DRAFT_503085 [Mortierella sp. GBAus27b]|nr:hypothetical protein BGX31_001611 [Mortierella sp. GBA43]KAI8346964.1 hypothetical protein B0O80DRAFT_503085 [Mortierella sp. GBAus27b]
MVATTLFKEDLYLASQRNLSGCRGNGPLDFSIHSQDTHSCTLGVTEVKKDDFKQGIAQNIVQLESALTSIKKRKRDTQEMDGEEESMVVRSYVIVTDASQWMLVECTQHDDEGLIYKVKNPERTVSYSGNWQDDMRDEILNVASTSENQEGPAREQWLRPTAHLSH